MISKVGLPRISEPFGDLDSDTVNGRDTYKANKEPKAFAPCLCVGCIPIFNWSLTMSFVLVFS
jgi:hypothetical protein